MPYFEFVVGGSLPLGADSIRATAQACWAGKKAANFFVSVSATYYYRASSDNTSDNTQTPPDIHAVLLPLLDAMQGIVYAHRCQVFSVASDRVNLAFPVDSPSPVLADGLARCRELLHVWVLWDDEE